MALFQGDDLIDVTTPDGRTLTLPRSAVPASMMPQQQIASGLSGPTGYTAETPGPGPDLTSVTGGQLPTPDMQQAPPAPAQPDLAPVVVDTAKIAKDQTAKQKQDAKAAKAQTAPRAQMAGAEQQTQTAIGDEKQATDNAANVDAAAQDLVASASEDHNRKIDALFEKRAVDAQAAADAEQQKMEQIAGIRKKIAGTKIDRSADHPIIAALSIALAGLGSAMQNRYTNNPLDTSALNTFWKALDRKVANQMGDVDMMEKTYGMSKDELGSLKEMSNHKLEMYNTLIAGEADKAKRHLEEIIAKSASEKTRANAKILMAQIDQRAAAAHSDATRWGLEYDQRDKHQQQQLGLGYAQLGESRRANMAGEQLKREDMYLDAQKYMAQIKASGDTEAYKAALKQTEEVSKRGIRDTNGDLVMTPEGRAKSELAKQLEDEATKTEAAGQADPMGFSVKGGKQRVEMLRERAAQLRGEANANGSVLGFNDTDATKVSDLLAAGQSTVQLIDRIKALSDQAGRGLIQRNDAQVKLQAMFNELGPNLKEAWQLGAWDKGSAALVANIIGADPTSDWNSGVLAASITGKMYEDPKSFKGRLDSVVDGLEDRAKNTLIHRGAKFSKNDRVLAREATLDTDSPTAKAAGDLAGPTPLGMAEDTAKSGGAAARVLDTFTPGVGPGISREDQARNIEERNGSLKRIGLTDKQAKGFDTLLTSYKSGNVADGDQLVASVVNQAQKQPDLAIALAHNLREHAPDLYTKMRALTPKGSKLEEQMTYEENSRIGSALNDTPTITAMVINTLDTHGKVTDQDGWRELARRATTGDMDAKKALLEIAKQSGYYNTLPAGSIFNGRQ